MQKFLEKFTCREDLLIAGLITVYCLTCYIIAAIYGFGDFFTPLMYLQTQLIFSCGMLLLYVLYRLVRVYYVMLVIRPVALKNYLWEDLKRGPLNPQRWRQFPVLFIAFIFFYSTFTCMKILISEIHPFAWDEFMMQADKTIHLGSHPWEWLHAMIGYPLITKIIAFVYILWFPGVFAVMYWQLFSIRNPQLRFRFFLTLVLTWAINGTFLATFFSSAGPAFYHNVTGGDHYEPLMAYLRSVNDTWDIYALKAQDYLWDNYTARGKVLAGGISAFPSIHVATTFLFVLLGWHTSRFWFRLFLAWFLLILIGSIHLGWHYAVDGYFSILMTWALWSFAGKIIPVIAIPAQSQRKQST